MKDKRETDVVIVGAGLTGLTLAFYLKKSGKKVMVAERSERTGGVIRTLKKNGFVLEAGPNTGILSTPEIVELFEDLEPQVTLETPGDASKSRWIWKAGRWHALPAGLKDAINTPLFKTKDKIGILGEPFRRRGTNPDETVAALVKRRLGESYLDYAVDPFISGIYAGDPDRLITRYALPKLYRLEQEHGSFIRGAVKKSFAKKTEQEKKVTREVFSVKGGLQELTDALEEAIGKENFLCGCDEISIDFESGRFTTALKKTQTGVELSYGSSYVITTTGATSLTSLLQFIPKSLLQPVTDLNYARVVQVAAGFTNWEGIAINAFGGLIPSKENRQALGILFPSSIFDGRAPEGGALLSVFLGGIKRPNLVSKTDEEIKAIARDEICTTLQACNEPDLLRVFRYEHAIPQYEKSTGDRLKAISAIEQDFPGLILAGNIRDGIGMADRVKQARNIAQTITG
jgi:protoporphyrinogen/coproporphyrinogen III oxidase